MKFWFVSIFIFTNWFFETSGINYNSKFNVEQVTVPLEHGEEPHWDEDEQVLYFVDIHQGNVLRYDPESTEVSVLHLEDGDLSPVLPVRDRPDDFLVGLNRQLCFVSWNGKNETLNKSSIKVLDTVDVNAPLNRFNDGKADVKGRVWLGTIGFENSSGVVPNEANFYRFAGPELDQVSIEISPVTNSNGLAWNKDNTKFYYIDTPTRQIAGYDYNQELGSIRHKTIVFDLQNYNIPGHPDGMTIDANDNLWVALYGGGRIINVDPRSGQLLDQIEIPASQVTSAAFGGDNLDILYVTTSRFGLNSSALEKEPAAGAVFKVTKNESPFEGRVTYKAVYEA